MVSIFFYRKERRLSEMNVNVFTNDMTYEVPLQIGNCFYLAN